MRKDSEKKLEIYSIIKKGLMEISETISDQGEIVLEDSDERTITVVPSYTIGGSKVSFYVYYMDRQPVDPMFKELMRFYIGLTVDDDDYDFYIRTNPTSAIPFNVIKEIIAVFNYFIKLEKGIVPKKIPNIIRKKEEN
jgi:hypothetical protein